LAESHATDASRIPPSRFYPVDVDVIDRDVLELDLYIWHERSPRPVLYRASGVEFTTADRRELLSNGVEALFIPDEQHATYRAMLARRIDDCFEHTEADASERAGAARHICRRSVEDVLRLPDRPEAVLAVQSVSRTLARWCREQPRVFALMLDMGAHDYFTLAHLINVGVGCAMLAARIRPDDEELVGDCLQGGLLHDIGKRAIPESVLTKEGRLSAAEWEFIRKHPGLGYKELEACPGIPSRVLEMVRDHHERLDGMGYPAGLLGSAIGLHTRICTVVDCFDAIVSKRPYREPIHPSQAIRLLSDGAEAVFDPEVLLAWSRLVSEMLNRDPDRARGMPAPGAVTPPLSSLLPSPMPEGLGESPADGSAVGDPDNRRRFPRTRCNAPIKAVFLRQGKAGPVLPGEVFELQTLDIAKGGLLLQTDWPFTLGDVLALILPQGDAPPIRLYARVGRVRRDFNEQGKWLAGVRFVPESQIHPASPLSERRAS